MSDLTIRMWTKWQYAQSLSQRTVTERISTVRRFAEAQGVDPITAEEGDIVTWLAEGGDWSASSRHTYHCHLTAWFAWLQRSGYREGNPMANVPTPKRPKGKPHPVADEQLARLLRTTMRKRTRVMILLAALAGLRVHEIAKFRGEHVDIVGRTLTVKGKGGRTDVIKLHPLLLEAAYTMPRKGWWFTSEVSGTGHVRRESVSSTISGAMVRANVPGSAHSIRHWYGTALVGSGADLRTAQKLLRHASLATTEIYVDVADARKAEAIDRLDPFAADAA